MFIHTTQPLRHQEQWGLSFLSERSTTVHGISFSAADRRAENCAARALDVHAAHAGTTISQLPRGLKVPVRHHGL